MKTVTVADLRNNFRRLSAYLERGETVEITKRGRLYAKLSPLSSHKRKLVKPDIMARLKARWGDRVLSAKEVQELRELEREGDWG
jgi:antitoxin (DNA-binding transcriptional repressor) of toxin-antitoxin stability system